MDRLSANPSSTSSIYGMPDQQSDQSVLDIVNKLKDREMQDFRDKANFMSDLSLRQEQRMRNLYDPEKSNLNQKQNTVMVNQMTPYEQGELGIKQQGLNLESQRIGQQGKLGQQALDIKSQQEQLNKQKSDQINAQKQADLERKINEANQKIELAQQALQQKSDNAAAQLEAHKALAAAVEERHKLELDMKQHQFDVTSEQHQKQIKLLEERLKQAGVTETTTEINPERTRETVTTKRGDKAGTVNVIGKDGNQYTIPRDKLNDMDADGTPHWKQIGGEEE